MATQEIGTFTHWKLSRQEILEGGTLSNPQKQILQNELAMIAENITNLDYDQVNPTRFAQDQAFLKGQMSILRVMLLRSDESEATLRNLAEHNSSQS